MTLSFKILRYNFFIEAFIPFVTEPDNITRFGLTTLQVSSLTDFLSQWQTDIKPYVDPIGNTTRTIETINTDYINGFKLTQGVRSQIKNNSTIVLTADERAICNIPKPDYTHSPAGGIKIAPTFACVGIFPLVMRFVALNPELPFKRAKPDGVSTIGIKTAITKAGDPPPKPEDYHRQEDENSTEFELLFTSEDVGKTLYVVGFYLNGRNESGKDGLPYIITIM